MQSDDQKKHPGEEHHYGQHPQTGGYPTQNIGAEPGDQYPQPGGYITRHSGAIVDPTPQPGSYVPQIYTDPGKLMEQPPKRPNPWKASTLVLSVVTVVLLATSTILVVTRPSGSNKVVVAPTATVASAGQQPTSAPTSGTSAGVTPTESASATATSGVASDNYSAALPGLGCDKNGGTWTDQGLDGIACPSSAGTELVINASGSRGYLYLQLPNNKAFSSNNTLSITGVLGDTASGYQTKCIGLAEQDANTGYLAEYCNDGKWFADSISSGGVILKTLDKSVTTAMTTAEISLTLKGTMLSFSVDNNILDTATISPVQPAKVAVVYDCVGYGANSTINGNYLLINGLNYMPQSAGS